MTLFIVSTPIGNLSDITLRALDTLKEVDLILCEDTRHTKNLLTHYDIKTKIDSFHAHSSFKKLDTIIKILKTEKDIALVSDAGTPGISDPGVVLIKKSVEENIKITPIPGVTAFVTALSVSGLPIDKFTYLGFLPVKKGRKTLFDSLEAEKRTVVFYESPHRILKTLTELEIRFPDRKIVIAREMTKIYEEFFRGDIKSALKYFTKNKPKGEFVVILGRA